MTTTLPFRFSCAVTARAVFGVQLASDDLGASFRQVYKTDGTAGGGRFTILDVGGVFHAYFVDVATNELARYKVGSAFQSFANTTKEDLIGSGTDGTAGTEVAGGSGEPRH